MELTQLRALVTTVERGSIVDASRALNVSAATLRARLDALEVEVGAPLLVRTHRGVEPTERGASFVVGAKELLRSADVLMDGATRGQDEALGELRSVAAGFSLPPMVDVVTAIELRRRYPGLKLRLESSADPLRDAAPDVDVVVLFGDPPAGGPWRTFALARFPVRLLASADYLARRGRPRRVEDLADHDLMCWLPPAGDGATWPLLDGGSIDINPCISCTDVFRLRGFAAAGIGVALLPDAELARGTIPGEELEEVLPDVVGREGVLRVLMREATAGSRRTAIVKEVLREVAGGILGPIAADWLINQRG
ncbi:MAG TPA: LysR family transcriptional regulator [Myxococcota bacterium]|nr:LysR family transcriptional regulator [Myxococcota bacterium]